jgi:hypothetical protein
MFDLAAILVLLVALWRSMKRRFPLGVAAAAVAVVSLVGAGVSALESRAGEGCLEAAIGLIFGGPSIILHERDGLLGYFASPLSVCLTWLGGAMAAMKAAERRGESLPPHLPATQAWAGIELAFAGVTTCALIRLVTILTFWWMTPD